MKTIHPKERNAVHTGNIMFTKYNGREDGIWYYKEHQWQNQENKEGKGEQKNQ
jgi:hypothetical protein